MTAATLSPTAPDEVRARTEVRMAPALLAAMSEAAATGGRSQSEVWAEAAREWLLRHRPEDDPQPPPPAASALRPAAQRAAAERERCWAAIDILLSDLRAPQPMRPVARDGLEPAA
jgi:hypothetical protein